jgi:hypothetical protein
VYLALYARRAWVIFDHPYNAEYVFLRTAARDMAQSRRSRDYVAVNLLQVIAQAARQCGCEMRSPDIIECRSARRLDCDCV